MPMQPDPPYFVPATEVWGRWVSVLCCKECAQVMARANFSEAKGTNKSIHLIEGETAEPCPRCGHITTCQHGKDGSTIYGHVTDGVARFRTKFRWWNPWTWNEPAKWELEPKTQARLAPLSPVEQLALVAEEWDDQ